MYNHFNEACPGCLPDTFLRLLFDTTICKTLDPRIVDQRPIAFKVEHMSNENTILLALKGYLKYFFHTCMYSP